MECLVCYNIIFYFYFEQFLLIFIDELGENLDEDLDENLDEDLDENLDLFLDILIWSQGISRAKYSSLLDILKARGFHLPSHFRLQSYLRNIINLRPQYFDCCVNSCMAYTGQYSDLTACSNCQEPRYVSNSQRSRKTFCFISLIDRLKLQYSNADHATILSTYRANLHLHPSADGTMRDFFDGDLYRQFHTGQLKLFQDSRDIALQLSIDGVQVTNRRNFEINPIIFINLNLSLNQ